MLKTFLTVDVEMWPDSWDLEREDPRACFARYIQGRTVRGDYGLPFQLRILKEHGLKCTFFVEPMFSLAFGLDYLREIVALIKEGGQEIELHLHTEWVDKVANPIVAGESGLHLKDFSFSSQSLLIGWALQRISAAGAQHIKAFRAGNFGANRDTIKALEQNGIFIDSSANGTVAASMLGTGNVPTWLDRVMEIPMTVYTDSLGRHRHAQITSCSSSELAEVAEKADSQGLPTFSVFWHSAELLNGRRNRHDPIVLKRFTRFCEYLAKRGHRFETLWLSEAPSNTDPVRLEVNPASDGNLTSSGTSTVRRYGEQLLRKAFR